jgi:Na+/proline symporter
MDRKEFTVQLWNRIVRPLIIVAMIYFSIRFLVAASRENGDERILSILFLSLTILFASAYLIGIFLTKIRRRIYTSLSDKTRFYLRIANKAFEYLAIVVLGAMLYKFWHRDWFLAATLILFLVVDRLREIIKKEKGREAR